MKPVDNQGGFVFRPDLKPAPVAQRKKSAGKSFMALFRPAEAEAGAEEVDPDAAGPEGLEEQLDRIHELGQKLLKSQTLEQVKAYKAAVKAFMQHFLRHGIEAGELVSNRSVMNQKKYTIVRIVDENLERLVTGILQSQVKQMDILSRLEEIQGLLVDLVH